MDQRLTNPWHANVSHRGKFILLAPPRNGARFSFVALKSAGIQHLVECSPAEDAVTHSMQIPPQLDDYRVLLLVRNPYTRMLSIWKWQNKILGRADSFAAFYARIRPGWLSLGVAIDCEMLRRVTNIIHLETWVEDIEAANLGVPYPGAGAHRCASVYLSEKMCYYTPGLLRRVAEDYAEDFVIGGYDPDAAFV